jgi:diaminopimelate epimerase
MGNPHATFFVADADSIDLATLGPDLEHDPLFPERANIGVATVYSAGDPAGPAGGGTGDRIRLRVWERGAGITLACGSGACAALIAAHRRGLTGRRATVALDGGDLDIFWREDADGRPGHVVMTGPAVLAFEGWFDAARFGL